MSIIITQSLSWEIEPDACIKSTKHIERWLVLACLVHQYSNSCDLVSTPFLVGIPPDSLQFLFQSSLRSFHCLRSPLLGSGMNVENINSSGHSPVSQITTCILCILSSTVSPPALNSSAGTSSGPVSLRLAV